MPESQEQRQSQSIQISVASAGDIELERAIFLDVSSVGRQLGCVSDVLELVIAALKASPGFAAGPDLNPAIAQFQQMQLAIQQEKDKRDSERLIQDPDRLVNAIERLQGADPAAYARLRRRLGDWVAASPPAAAPPPVPR